MFRIAELAKLAERVNAKCLPVPRGTLAVAEESLFQDDDSHEVCPNLELKL